MAGWHALQSSRFAFTSGRSSSLTRIDFFRGNPRTVNARAKAERDRANAKRSRYSARVASGT